MAVFDCRAAGYKYSEIYVPTVFIRDNLAGYCHDTMAVQDTKVPGGQG